MILRAIALAFCSFVVASCSDYSPIPRTGTAFEAEAQRISDNLAKPIDQPTPLGPNAQPYGPTRASGGGGSTQPIIVGQAANEDLLRGLTDTPIGSDLRFSDADIGEVARTVIGDILKKPYVIDTSLRGTVSLRVASTVSERGLMDALRQEIQRAGGEIRRVGGSYEIANARPAQIDDQRIAQLRAANTSVSIVPLRNARASTVVDLLRAIYPSAAPITVDASNNLLVIGGPGPERAQIASTAELLDVDGMNNQTVAVYRLNQSNPREVADELRRLYGGGPANGVDFLPLPRNNALMVVARNQATLARVSQLVQTLDRSRRSEGRRMYVISLQHARAPVLANVLREALGMPPSSVTTATAGPSLNPLSGQPMSMSVMPSASSTPPGMAGPPPGGPAPAPAPGSSVGPAGSADSYGGGTGAPWELDSVPLRIVANAETNALLIFATFDEFGLVQEAVRRLDAPPLQVLIEATIMDVTLTDRLQFGVQAFLQQQTAAGNLVQTGITAAQGFAALTPQSAGFNFIFSNPAQVQAAVNALRTVTTVTVLSAPQVVTEDNQRARLEVGEQVPISTQSITQSTVNNPAVINSISYVQTGVILAVTPRVNLNGGVDLDIRQEVTDAPASNPNAPSLNPVLTRRVIETRVSVQSTQTVALGGLITERSSDDRSRVPGVGDIPVVGWLFGQTNVGRQKRELLVFLTPTVVTNPAEARNFTLELRRRIEGLWQKEGSNRRSP